MYRLSAVYFIAVNAREENPITVPFVPWPTNGYASFSPTGRPTSLTTNLSTLRPLATAVGALYIKNAAQVTPIGTFPVEKPSRDILQICFSVTILPIELPK
jgi:hypothetical protein